MSLPMNSTFYWAAMCWSVFAAVIDTEIIEDIPGTGETADSSQNPGTALSAVSPPSQERESYKKLGLTKQVLAAHTQKEEQAFLYRFKELRGLTALKANCSQYLERQREQITTDGTSDTADWQSHQAAICTFTSWPTVSTAVYSLCVTPCIHACRLKATLASPSKHFRLV